MDTLRAPPERKAKAKVNMQVNVKICWALGAGARVDLKLSEVALKCR